MGAATSPTFEDRYESICHEIEKRRRGWTISAVDFDDVKQIILIHVANKLRQFNPAKVLGDPTTGFARWLNGLISSQISNIARQNFRKWSRPCISNTVEPRGCPFNSGGDTCSQTPSGKQCNECPIYAKWEKRKIAQFNTRQTLPLDNHYQEVSNKIGDFQDLAASKTVIDRAILSKLSKHEQKLYRLLYIRGVDEKTVGKMMHFRKVGRMFAGYQPLTKFRHKVVAMARLVISAEGLA